MSQAGGTSQLVLHSMGSSSLQHTWPPAQPASAGHVWQFSPGSIWPLPQSDEQAPLIQISSPEQESLRPSQSSQLQVSPLSQVPSLLHGGGTSHDVLHSIGSSSLQQILPAAHPASAGQLEQFSLASSWPLPQEDGPSTQVPLLS